ncbi:MAG: hypothetical protein ACXVR9_09450 [Gaiellaceae bacterium]
MLVQRRGTPGHAELRGFTGIRVDSPDDVGRALLEDHSPGYLPAAVRVDVLSHPRPQAGTPPFPAGRSKTGRGG